MSSEQGSKTSSQFSTSAVMLILAVELQALLEGATVHSDEQLFAEFAEHYRIAGTSVFFVSRLRKYTIALSNRISKQENINHKSKYLLLALQGWNIQIEDWRYCGVFFRPFCFVIRHTTE